MLPRPLSNSWPQRSSSFSLLKCWDYRHELLRLANLTHFNETIFFFFSITITRIWRFVYQHCVHGHNIRSSEALHIFQNLGKHKNKNKPCGKSEVLTTGTKYSSYPHKNQEGNSLRTKRYFTTWQTKHEKPSHWKSF